MSKKSKKNTPLDFVVLNLGKTSNEFDVSAARRSYV